LLDSVCNIKLCDFGWSAEEKGLKRNTFCGTYEYMAPEMLFKGEYDYRVDIWALGILLYEMLHGRAPFKGKTASEVKDSMLKGSYEMGENLS
jgi:serine/threonine protein kinase